MVVGEMCVEEDLLKGGEKPLQNVQKSGYLQKIDQMIGVLPAVEVNVLSQVSLHLILFTYEEWM